jgi:hypothetical protein
MFYQLIFFVLFFCWTTQLFFGFNLNNFFILYCSFKCFNLASQTKSSDFYIALNFHIFAYIFLQENLHKLVISDPCEQSSAYMESHWARTVTQVHLNCTSCRLNGWWSNQPPAPSSWSDSNCHVTTATNELVRWDIHVVVFMIHLWWCGGIHDFSMVESMIPQWWYAWYLCDGIHDTSVMVFMISCIHVIHGWYNP